MKFFNSLSQQKEVFKSIIPLKVKMYCCGITPYSTVHLGHIRTFFSFDLLYRILIDAGYEVEWARNVTDVDDKIIFKALAEKKSCQEITNRYMSEQIEYLKVLDLHNPLFEPRVTDNISQIIEMIHTLIQKEFAYISPSGVYFRVRKFPHYGKLSKNKIADLKKGVRIEIDETKEDALDFALWKFAKRDEIFWESPWGPGRPGWHIECSAMIHALFGNSIDIHMGGRDLIFPHHEAEIAQSEACTGCTLANYWLHCGMVTLYHEKMSKSSNHYVSVEDFLKQYSPEVLRLLFLSSSYSQPLDFTFELASENLKKLSRIYRFVALVDSYALEANQTEKNLQSDNTVQVFANLSNLKQKMRDFLSQDMNSAMALAEFLEFIRIVNCNILNLEKNGHMISQEDKNLLLREWPDLKNWMQSTLALLTQSPKEYFEHLEKFHHNKEISDTEILNKIEKRNQFRAQKNWQEADAIRDELHMHGIQIMDTPRGTKWFLS